MVRTEHAAWPSDGTFVDQGAATRPFFVMKSSSTPPPRHRDVDELPFHEAVWAMVRRVPRGRATSYGAVAAFLGSPRAARGVGYALAALPADNDVPWWRVLNHAGEVSIKGAPGL